MRVLLVHLPFLKREGEMNLGTIVGRHMSYSLNSLKGGYIGDYIGDYYRGYQVGY